MRRVDKDGFSPDYQFWSFLLKAEIDLSEGNPGSARAHYREFLARWGEADLQIPEVEKARSRLARLESR